jgi:NAD(P)-dependent dehydrogenase (short-subunit alcohol dehydrogenase family)
MSRSIIITGATGNLGSAVTTRLLSDGYTLYTTLVPGEEAADDARIRSKIVDLFNEQESAQYIADIAAAGSDIAAGILLVGGFAMGGLKDTDMAALDKMFRLNFYTAFSIVRPLFEYFEKKGGGQIILIGARPALMAAQGRGVVAYALSKGLVFHLAEIINEAGKEKNIRATVVVPSTIDTAINRASMPNADFHHWVPAEKIADVISFILTDSGAMLRETVLKMYNEA